MEIKLNTPVEATNGSAGHVTHLIVNPVKNELTHIVVKHHGEERELEASHILSTSEDTVKIDCSTEYVHRQPNFIDVEYIQEPEHRADVVDMYGIYYHPYVTMATHTARHEHIPVGEVSFTRSTPVFTEEGQVGKIDELVVNPVNYHITHIVLREGHLWGQRDVVIGLEHIDHTDEEGVHLKMTREQVEDLPDIAIQRHFSFDMIKH